MAAFGGVVALNRPLNGDVAAVIAGRFIEVLITPEVETVGALENQPNVRILEAPIPHNRDFDLRRVEDGLMLQQRDVVDTEGWEVLSSRQPQPGELEDLLLAWKVAAHTKSNSVVLTLGGQTVGVGAGDQSRIGSAERAHQQAGERAPGAKAASDAIFPFTDGVEIHAAAGVAGIVAPTGSKRDADVLATAERLGLLLVRAPHRHFKH
jgi:phosphoribosylaminoimidazolecarboxamide formyltransferase/IMP cyclohydrolase